MDRKKNKLKRAITTAVILTALFIAAGYVGYSDTEDARILTASVWAR